MRIHDSLWDEAIANFRLSGKTRLMSVLMNFSHDKGYILKKLGITNQNDIRRISSNGSK